MNETPDLYEYKYLGNEQQVVHVWITENEFKVAQWALSEDAGISARMNLCPEDCDYRKLPHPSRKPHGTTNFRATKATSDT